MFTTKTSLESDAPLKQRVTEIWRPIWDLKVGEPVADKGTEFFKSWGADL